MEPACKASRDGPRRTGTAGRHRAMTPPAVVAEKKCGGTPPHHRGPTPPHQQTPVRASLADFGHPAQQTNITPPPPSRQPRMWRELETQESREVTRAAMRGSRARPMFASTLPPGALHDDRGRA